MSLKTIFSDDVITTYAPITGDDWNSTISNDPVYQYSLTMSQGGSNEYPLTLTITQLFGSNYYTMCIHTGLLSLSSIQVSDGSNDIWKSTTPIGNRFYNLYNGIQLGYSSGCVFGSSELVVRPCEFSWYLDTEGYLYLLQAYNAGYTPTDQWSVGVVSGYSYVPSCSTKGKCVDRTAFEDGDLLFTDTTFIVSTLRVILGNGVVSDVVSGHN